MLILRNRWILNVMAVVGGVCIAGIAGAAEQQPGSYFKIGIGLATDVVEYKKSASEDDVVVVLPYLEYEGERLHFSGTSLSYDVIKTGLLQVSLLAENNGSGFDAGDLEIFKGMADRDYSIDLGAQFAVSTDFGDVAFSVTKDVNDAHDSEVMKLSYQYMLHAGKWVFIPGIGLQHLASDFVDYYYGVRANEATRTRAAYKGRSTTQVSLNLLTAYQISPRFQVVNAISLEALPDEIKNSPLVKDDSTVLRGFLGLSYQF